MKIFKKPDKQQLIVFLCFWLFFAAVMSMQTPVDRVLLSDRLASFELTKPDPIRPRSEYRVCEQLSKFCLLLIILISVIAYQKAADLKNVHLSVCFFMLGILLYLSESNIIPNDLQPFYGGAVLSFLFFLLIRARAWPVIFLLTAGLGFILLGVLSDRVHDNEQVRSLVPALLSRILFPRYEELYEAVGIGFVCCSALLCFFERFQSFVRGNMRGFGLLCLFLGMISAGNGLLHFKYYPVMKVEAVALGLCWGGLAGIIWSNERIFPRDRQLALVTKEIFSIFILSFFVVLPTVFGQHQRKWEAVILWLPLFVVMALFLIHDKKKKWTKASSISGGERADDR